MKKSHKSVIAVALAAALSVGVAACGSSDSSSGDGDTWRIGLEAPLSGDTANLGKGMLHGAQLAADEINADGGVLGKQIEIVEIDDAGDPKTGVTAANAAISEGLDGVVGPYNSSVGLETLPLYTDAKVLPVRLTSDTGTEGFGITLQPMSSQIAPVTAKALTDYYGAKSVGILYDSTEAYTKETSSKVKQELEAAGISVSDFVAIQPGKSDYTNTLKSVEGKSPDVIYSVVYFPEAAVMAKDLQSLGLGGTGSKKCLFDYATYDQGYLNDAGVRTAQTCDVAGVPAPTDFAGSSTDVSKFQDEFGESPNVWSPYTYDSLNILVDAAKQVGGFDYGQLSDYLGTVSGWKGWTGTVNIEAKTGNREPATVVITQVTSDGNFETSPAWAKAVGAPY
ncbi:MAG: branched-chain amino acid ABC transporter substrate-binding protein [bacterium]